MICYKDRTFCSYYGSCLDGESCDRALTEYELINSEHFDLPICQFVEEPSCFKLKEVIDEN